MTRTLSAGIRRMNRLMRASRRTAAASLSLQKAMTGLVTAALSTTPSPNVAKAKAAKAAKARISGSGKPAGKTQEAEKLRAKKAQTNKVRAKKARADKILANAPWNHAPKAPRRLGDVIALLRAARSLAGHAARDPGDPAKTPRVPDGASFQDRTHRSAAGARAYKLYLPASRSSRPRGLILMLHGCSQNPDDFASGTGMNALAERQGFAVAYPAQDRRHNGASCWNWFSPTHQNRGAGEPAILASLTKSLMREFGLDREAVFVAGLSAGGAMAAILAEAYPDTFAAAGIHSGLARGAARDVASAMSAMRDGAAPTGAARLDGAAAHTVRRIVFHGSADRTVHPSNAASIVAAVVGSDAAPLSVVRRTARGRDYVRSRFADSDGRVLLELWIIEGSGHAWSGGRREGSYSDPEGPHASLQMLRFFIESAPGGGG